jgi:SAM-dependent methyltransferase
MAWFGVRKGVSRLLPGLTYRADQVVERTLARLPTKARIVDLGAGGRRITQDTITVDAFAADGTDVIADVHVLPIADGVFDAAFCTGTLEHVENPRQVLAEARRILRPGGFIHVEVPFLQPFHADPTDFWRWTLPGLQLECRRAGFDLVESGAHLGPASSVAWTLNEFVLAVLGDGVAGTVGSAVVRVLSRPFLYVDRILVRRRRGIRSASGVYFLGKKT